MAKVSDPSSKQRRGDRMAKVSDLRSIIRTKKRRDRRNKRRVFLHLFIRRAWVGFDLLLWISVHMSLHHLIQSLELNLLHL